MKQVKKKISTNLGMVMVSNIGLMEHIMKANGILIKLKEMVHSGMLKEMCIKESLRMIWLMAMVNILISMEASIKVNSGMMFKKVMEKKNGLMVQNM